MLFFHDVADESTAPSAEESGGGCFGTEFGGDSGEIDAFASGIGLDFLDAVGVVGFKPLDKEGVVERGVEGDGEDHRLVGHEIDEEQLFGIDGALSAKDVAEGVVDEFASVDAHHFSTESADEPVCGICAETKGQDSVE
jgi:hypothetical protein